MKKCSLILILVISLATKGQQVYTCTYQQQCDWNNLSELYTDCDEGRAQNLTFEINKAESIILQKYQNVTTSFKIKSRERDRKNGITIYFVLNELGEAYYYIFDRKNNELRILSKSNGKSTLLIYSQTNPWQSN